MARGRSLTPSVTRLMRCSTSLAVVLVVAAPPGAVLVAAEGGAVEPLVHAPQDVEPAQVRRIGVVYDAVLPHERAHAGDFPGVGGPVHAGDPRQPGDPRVVLTGHGLGLRADGAEVDLAGSGPLLLRRVRGVEVVVEVGAVRGGPGKAPA